MTALGDVAIVGAGQVGTTVGLALRQAGPEWGVASVSLYDSVPSAARESMALGAGERTLPTAQSVLDANTVVLAAPVSEILAWLERFGPELRPGTTLVDTGSAKGEVVDAMARLVPAGVHAIGGHPMAGNEVSGPAGAVPGALTGAVFVLTPCRDDDEAVERGAFLARACGARPLTLSAKEHDRLLAKISHLPHLLASACAASAAGDAGDLPLLRDLVGPGFRGFTRLADSDPHMVAAFAGANRIPLAEALEDFRAELDRLTTALAAGEGALEAELTRGRQGRAAVLAKS